MLKLINVTKDYITTGEDVHALKGINLNFRRNEFVSILGPSGCGKTTMLNIIGGLDRYTSGDLIINGKSTNDFTNKDWDSYRNHTIGFVFQNYNLIPHQTILENVEIALTLSGVSKEERKLRSKEVLERVGLADKLNVRPNQLSGGQMQRVSIARALVNNPDVLLADEPTGALDTKTSIQILDLLKEIAKEKLVIMVTHNPELAKTYSTRIIRLVDGLIEDDSNPYEGEVYPEKLVENEVTKKKVKKEKKDKTKKTSMSFFTALQLSFKNLLTKKTRTFLVAFAGSIGIIGIATILSLSAGFNSYIENVEEDTLSTYPISLTKQTIDFSSTLASLAGKGDKEEHTDDKVYSNDIFVDMFGTMMSEIHENDLASFKSFIESNKEYINKYASTIKYTYNVPLNVYASDTTNGVLQVNPSTVFEDVTKAIGAPEEMANTYMENMNIWSELLDNPSLVESQYDIVKGTWPKASNEVVIVIDKNNEIPDFVLYTLGVKTREELNEVIEEVLTGVKTDKTPSSYTYDDLLNLSFKVLLNSDYYEKEIKDGKTIWTDKSEDDIYLANKIKDAFELKVVGIIKPNEDAVARSISGFIAYSSSLTKELINRTNNSEIVKMQINAPQTDVFSGNPFASQEITIDMIYAYIDALPKEEQDKLRPYLSLFSEEYLITMFKEYMVTTTTYEKNITKLGVCDIDAPSTISLFPVDFASKDELIKIIDSYNSQVENNGHEEMVIQYTDYIGILMSSISEVIDAVTYVLIAFVTISLVVSSIMIGIITYISVLERIKEIGILRSVGASKRDISRVFNAETIIIGFVSGSLGILITLVLIIPINLIIYSLGNIANVAKLPWLGAIILIVISVVLSFVAGLIPSRIAANKNPVEALRSE